MGKPGRLPEVLVVTSTWPATPDEISGIHVVKQVERLREFGLNVEVFAFQGRKNPLRYAQAILNFHKMDLDRFDLIHAHHGQSGIVALSQRRLPVIVTFHGSDLQGIRGNSGIYTTAGFMLRKISRWVARLADEVILVSSHMDSFIPKRSYHVIPMGVDMRIFSPMPMSDCRRKLELKQDKKLVLFVGNPHRPEKRFDLAQDTVRFASLSTPVELVVAGAVPHADMPLYMNACDVMLITSSHEGSPAAVKEALACNLPIVSVDVGDIRQRIESIDGCAITENEEAGTIAVALEGILRQKRRICGVEAVRDLDEGLLACKVINVYKAILRQNAKICTRKG